MAITSDARMLVRAFVDAINERNWRAVGDVVTEDFPRHSAAAGERPVLSRADLIEFLQREFETFPDAARRSKKCSWMATRWPSGTGLPERSLATSTTLRHLARG
ncbi:ester cyclase [Aquibium sp. LZ166]|uniref:Ester cyclase n=1 Tax=Aquibium pacificus TaxID=3153579 RepID=A0ABV3SJ61_9HYPH